MAAAPKPSGGRKPGQFGTTELRLGRATGIGEFFDVLEDATAKRMGVENEKIMMNIQLIIPNCSDC